MEDEYQESFFQRIKPLVISIQGKLKDIWPFVNRGISNFLFFIFTVIKEAIKIAKSQIKA